MTDRRTSGQVKKQSNRLDRQTARKDKWKHNKKRQKYGQKFEQTDGQIYRCWGPDIPDLQADEKSWLFQQCIANKENVPLLGIES